MKKSIFASILLAFSLLTPVAVTNTHAAWNHDGYGYVSNVCRSGPYWQFVPWNYVGTDCYMPGWGLWGKRVAE
jgi:hypothetical protein